MPKRARVAVSPSPGREEREASEANSKDSESDAESGAEDSKSELAVVAGFCEDKLREIVRGDLDHHPLEEMPRVEDGVLHVSFDRMVPFFGRPWSEFLKALEEEQSLSVEESKKAALQNAFNSALADAMRVHELILLAGDDKDVQMPVRTAESKKRRKEMSQHAEEWLFDISWALAKAVLDHGSEVLDSESSGSDPDEIPDSDSDDEDGEEEDSDDSDSGGSGSEEGSDA
jgi:hypothetical protein